MEADRGDAGGHGRRARLRPVPRQLRPLPRRTNGEGGVGPPLNDQAKLYNAVTADGGSGTGHLNPNYIHKVLEVGGRYVCGDAKSLMPAWLAPDGPLNYRAGGGAHRVPHGQHGHRRSSMTRTPGTRSR